MAVGSFADPEAAAGLAHLLEHVVFLGSERFPKRDEWEAFLARHGGSSNAVTQECSTAFHYTIQDEFLGESLQRFADMLFHPLLREQALEKEIRAVDAEFEIAKTRDDCRVSEIQRFTARKGHPFSRFCWGNKQSLTGTGSMANLADLLKKFHQAHYKNPKDFRIVVFQRGNKFSMEQIEEMIISSFGNMKAPQELIPKQPITMESPFDLRNSNLFHIEPATPKYHAFITWPLPSFDSAYKTKPADFVAELIDHEMQNSLVYWLRREGLALSVSSGSQAAEEHRNAFFWLFCIEIELSEFGAQNFQRVFQLVLKYLDIVKDNIGKGSYKVFWQGLKEISLLDYTFEEEGDPDEFVEGLAIKMQNPYIEKEHILPAESVFIEFDEAAINKLVERISSEGCRVDLLCPKDSLPFFDKISESPWKKDDWFGIKYREAMIPKEWLEGTQHSDFALPIVDKSLFPSNLDLISKRTAAVKMLEDPNPSFRPFNKLWHQQDTTLESPRANVFIKIFDESFNSSNHENISTATFIADLFGYIIADEEYLGSLCGLEFTTTAMIYPFGFEFSFHGFNDKIFEFVLKIISAFRNCLSSLTESSSIFDVLKESVKINLKSSDLNPSKLTRRLRNLVLYQETLDVQKQLSILSEISLANILQLAKEYLGSSDLSFECFVHGNVSEDSVIQFAESFKQIFPIDSNCDSSTELRSVNRHIDLPLTALPAGETVNLYFDSLHQYDSNSACCNYYQIGRDSLFARTMAKLLADMMHESCFDDLRTEQQLGYSVSCTWIMSYKSLGMQIWVLSPTHDPKDVDKRIEAFLEDFQTELNEMDDEEFKDNVNGLIADLMSEGRTVRELGETAWEEISNKSFIFDRRDKEVELLKTLTKSQVQSFYKDILLDSKTRRKLSVQVYSSSHISRKPVKENLKKKSKPSHLLMNVDEVLLFRKGLSNLLA